MKHWIDAIRLRTLPLALASIAMAGFLAYSQGMFNPQICLWAALTTLFLQILSNLANDYGDSVHGADHVGRTGPQRAVQAGLITRVAMKRAIVVTAMLSLVSGIYLLYLADLNREGYLVFLGLGILAVLAAVLYTNGYRPYGYVGLGDLFVLIFFGWLGVGGTYYLQTGILSYDIFLPATSVGLLTVAVLNINNIRDIDSDKKAGKFSVPVRLGRQRSLYYHGILLAGGYVCAFAYILISGEIWKGAGLLIILPLLIRNYKGVRNNMARGTLDPLLRQMAITTLVFVILFGFLVQ